MHLIIPLMLLKLKYNLKMLVNVSWKARKSLLCELNKDWYSRYFLAILFSKQDWPINCIDDVSFRTRTEQKWSKLAIDNKSKQIICICSSRLCYVRAKRHNQRKTQQQKQQQKQQCNQVHMTQWKQTMERNLVSHLQGGKVAFLSVFRSEVKASLAPTATGIYFCR